MERMLSLPKRSCLNEPVIDRGTRNEVMKTLNEVKPVENINKKCRVRMSVLRGEFDSRKDSHSAKFERRL